MDFSFENQGTHTYLVYTVKEDDIIDSMSLGMLTNNKIPGLAHTLFTQMDSTKFIKYDVSAKISVRQFFSGQVNKKRLIGVFNGIVDAMLSAEDYMIDVNSIVLDLDYIFADVSSCETVLICMPTVSDDLSVRDLGTFFKNIMFTTQFDQTENCDHVAKIINYLNSTPVFSLDEFKKLLEIIGGNAVSSQMQQTQAPKNQIYQGQNFKQQNTVQQGSVNQPPIQQSVAGQQQTMQNYMNQTSIQQGQVRQMPIQQTQTQQRPAMPNATNQMQNQVPPAQQQGIQQGAPEKKMSMLGLLMHYSKENAEIYKQQKATKKAGQAQMPATPSIQQPPKQQSGFAVPGQATSMNPGFVVPGQTTAVNAGFAVPGQQTTASKTGQQVQKPNQSQMQQQTQHPIQNMQQQMQQPSQRSVNGMQAQQTVMNQPPIYSQPQMPTGQAMNFGETTVLGAGSGIGETTVLGATPATQSKPHLVRSKNKEKIDLNKPVFRIGKEKSYVDYFIGDNSAISRSHANVISRDGEYFVVDTNSTNHTYVNGQMIQSNVETKITHGTVIRLANEDFEFKLY